MVAYLQSLDQAKHLQDSADAAVEVTTYLITSRYKVICRPPATGRMSPAAFINQIFTADQLPGHAAGRGGPGRGQHRPEPDPAVSGHGRRLADPSGGRQELR